MTAFSTAGTAFSAIPAIAPDHAHPYWTFERVADALGTGPRIPRPLAGVSTDTRAMSRGDVFVALIGEHFDAHDFLAAARDAGAAAFVVSDSVGAWLGLGVAALAGVAWNFCHWSSRAEAEAGGKGTIHVGKSRSRAMGRASIPIKESILRKFPPTS